MARIKTFVIPSLVVLAVIAVVGWAARSPIGRPPQLDRLAPGDGLARTVENVDRYLRKRWNEEQLVPATPADELLVLRRLSLALHGTIPSLEEIRQFEADTGPDRLHRWTANMLADDRFAHYFAERLARSLVGTEGGQFIVYRRDRFVDWLTDQLQANRPYDEMVRELITADGLWTGNPAANFITSAVRKQDVDENKLAGRIVRVFLGQRIDCAQCHDHPFDDWKQAEYEGLAAHFGQVRFSVLGVKDQQFEKNKKSRRLEPIEYEIEDPETLKTRKVPATVPFHPEWVPKTDNRRQRLAVWITHRENRRFERAVGNRIWGLLFGKPYTEFVDDIPDPGPPEDPDLLDIVGSDFRENGYDLRRLIHLITASEAFRLSSTQPTNDAAECARLKMAWAVFPLVRLRPEQVIGSMLQAASIKTIDQNSHLFIRFFRMIRENSFVKEYGDLGDAELEDHSGTIPQALLRMNGNFSKDTTTANWLSASGRIASVSSTDQNCLESCYLVCLSRRPTEAERKHFLAQLHGTKKSQRQKIVEDIFWALFNSPEFSWNH